MPLPPMRPSFGTNLPQIVTHICQKAIFKHALGEEVTMAYKILIVDDEKNADRVIVKSLTEVWI